MNNISADHMSDDNRLLGTEQGGSIVNCWAIGAAGMAGVGLEKRKPLSEDSKDKGLPSKGMGDAWEVGLGNETKGRETDDAWEAGLGDGTEGRDDDDGADESRELSSILSG